MITRTVVDTIPEYPNEQVTFYRRGGTFTLDEAYPGRQESVTTDDNGAYSIDLWPNAEGLSETSYLAVYPGKDSFEFVLEAGDDPITASELRAQYAWNWHTTPVPTAIALERARYANKVSYLLGSGLIGFILNATGAVGRWVQDKLSETVTAEDFGAVGDGVTDDTAALEALRTAAAGKRVVFGRNKTYAVSRQINWRLSSEGPKIDGNNSVIKAIAGTWNAGDAVFKVGDGTTIRAQIENLRVDASSLATYGFYFKVVTESNSYIKNLSATGALLENGYGMVFDQCQISIVENIHAQANWHGLLFDSCNALVVTNARANSSYGDKLGVSTVHRGNGITVLGRVYSGGITFFSPEAELNTGYGMVIDTHFNLLGANRGQGGPVRIISGWQEQNTIDYIVASNTSIPHIGGNGLDGILICSPHGEITGMRLSGPDYGDNYAIRVTRGGRNYTAPTVAISGGGGTGATATATFADSIITGLTVTAPGSGYATAPTVIITDPTGAGATATATVDGTGAVTALSLAGVGGWSLHDNWFTHETGNGNYDRVRLESGVTACVVGPNWRLASGAPALSDPSIADSWPGPWLDISTGRFAQDAIGIGTLVPIPGLALGSGKDISLAGGTISSPYGTIGAYGNLLTYSEDFSNAAWTKGASTTITANSVAAPNGTTTADTIAMAGADISVNRAFQNTGVVGTLTGRTFTASVWLRAAAACTVHLWLNNSNDGAATIKVCNVTTSWERFTVTHTFPTDALTAARMTLRLASAVTLYAWGAQMVEASSAGGYTRTTSAAVAAGTGIVANGLLVASSGLAVGNSAAATTPGSVVKRIEVFDASGASLGFVPVYNSIS